MDQNDNDDRQSRVDSSPAFDSRPTPAGDVAIRGAALTDAPEMARLADELGYPMSSAGMERRLERLLPDALHHIVVASDASGKLVAWMHVEHRDSLDEGERAELMGLVVDPSIRRGGLGRQMVDVAENWASARGLSKLWVRSNTARQVSHPFYETSGFTRMKTQRVYVKAVKRAR